MTILNNIKKRPDNQKKFFSLVLALVLTFFIVGFWYSFTSDSSVNKKTGESENKLSSVSPWQIIKDEFSKAQTERLIPIQNQRHLQKSLGYIHLI